MKRVAVILAVLAACACARDPERTLGATFDAARLAVRRGELTDAQVLVDRALSVARPDSEWTWNFRLLRGEILFLQHQPSEVLPLVKATLPAGAAFDPLRARQKYLEALVLRGENRFADALATLEEARRLAPASRDIQLDVACLDGQLRMRLGKWTQAESTLNAVVVQAAAAGDRYHEARALNDLGMGSLVRGRWDEALPRFERVLSFRDLEQLTVYTGALGNAGICYARLGEFDRALAIQRRSVSLHSNRGQRADFEQALGELGNTLVQQGNPRQALRFVRQALDVAKEHNLQADAALWAGNLASANIALNQWDEAALFNDEATRLKSASRTGNPVYNTLNAALIAQGRGRLDEARSLFEQALAGAESDAILRWSAHAGLASIAVAAAQPDQAARHFEAALDTIEKTRADLRKTDYKLTFLTRLILFYQAYVDALVDQGRFERALEISESSRGRVLAERNGLAPPAKPNAAMFRDVSSRSRTILVSFWLGPVRSYAWVVTPGGVRIVHLPPAVEIETLVRGYQSMIDNGLADPLAATDSPGDRLYRLLVEPILPLIGSGTRLVIVPDGALHGLNFETLPVAGERRHYLIEDVEIQTAPTLAMLASPPTPQTGPPSSLLLIGDPAPHDPDFPRLKHAVAEMANVSKHFAPAAVTAFQGGDASPEAYRAAPPDRFTFVHFTAHAAANFQSPLDSAVILSGPESGFKLYARDVAEVPLRAELVTVSACRSAGERAYSGEGLVGFAWAFLRAGARRVIAGLWDVDDRSTAQLMDHMYGRVVAGDSPSRALRDAKLAFLAKGGNFARPYYWGPFQLFTVAP